MTPTPHRPTSQRTRRRAGAALLATALAAGTTGIAAPTSAAPATGPEPQAETAPGKLDWGVKQSFRNYIANVAQGTITVAGGATQAPSNGVFTFPSVPSWAGQTEIDATFVGSVRFQAHGGALDVTVGDLRVEASGDTGSVIADVTSLPNEPDSDPVLYDDVTIADLDLTGITPVVSSGSITWTGVPATLTEDGVPAFADFYAEGTELDPLTISLPRTDTPAKVEADRSLTNLDPCKVTTVDVSGSGFDPDANLSTRMPVPVGQPAGVYVVFGRFPDQWKPSDGVSTGRTVLHQRWAMPEPSYTTVTTSSPNPQYRLMEADGTFEADLDIEKVDGEGNFGIYTYAAGGATPNAAQETYTPVSFRDGFVDVPESHQFHEAIAWMDDNCFASGWDDGTFRPTLAVSRQAFASFLYRMAGSPDVPVDAPTFSDVSDSNPFQDAIRWLASEGVINGWADGTFRPTLPVSRQAAAAFLHRYEDSPEPADDAPEFSDLPSGEFGVAIRWMAGEGITDGWPDNTFRPTLPVSRQANASFLYKTFGQD